VRSTGWKYVRYATGEEELYDLSADPFESQNQASNPNAFYQNQLVPMRAQEQQLCQPEPPGGLP
jgi:hypothetical protein